MAYSDISGFVGVSLDDIFAAGLERSQLSKKTRVAVLETDGKAVLEEVRKTNRGQDCKTLCEVDLGTVRETDPKTDAERNRE